MRTLRPGSVYQSTGRGSAVAPAVGTLMASQYFLSNRLKTPARTCRPFTAAGFQYAIRSTTPQPGARTSGLDAAPVASGYSTLLRRAAVVHLASAPHRARQEPQTHDGGDGTTGAGRGEPGG